MSKEKERDACMTQHKALLALIRQELHHRQALTQRYDWAHCARPNQLLPSGDWRVWLILAGRGFGKTRTGAETLRQWATSGRYRRIALISGTVGEARAVMVEGQSGLLDVHPVTQRPHFEATRRRL